MPQAMPRGKLKTEPEPVPAKITDRVAVGANVAVTKRFELIVTVHVPVPVQAPPLQPMNADPDAGAAVSVTAVLLR